MHFAATGPQTFVDKALNLIIILLVSHLDYKSQVSNIDSFSTV